MSIHDLTNDQLEDRADDAQEVVEYLIYLQGLLEESRYQFAADTIEGIAKTIELRKSITPGQRTAIRNIVRGADEAAERREQHRPSRRYEGWRR